MAEKPSPYNFPENGLVWGLHRELYAGTLALQLAFLLQAAHPGTTEGFLKYSTFKKDPARRVVETAAYMDTITYGTQQSTQPLLDSINAMHAHIARRDSGLMNQESQGWVGLSFIYALAKVNSTFLHMMTPRQLDAYYASARDGFLPLFGVDPDNTPRTFDRLETWMQDEVRSGRVHVTPRARDEIAPAVLFQEPMIFSPDLLPDGILRLPGVQTTMSRVASRPRRLDKITYPLRKATTGLLFPELREGYGLSWNRFDQTAFRTAATFSRVGYSTFSGLIPSSLRFTPGYLEVRNGPSNARGGVLFSASKA